MAKGFGPKKTSQTTKRQKAQWDSIQEETRDRLIFQLFTALDESKRNFQTLDWWKQTQIDSTPLTDWWKQMQNE